MNYYEFFFYRQEKQVQHFWDENEIFQQSLKQSQQYPAYTTYDGPPFATGKPHHGHLLASTIKDIVHRYFTQQGYYREDLDGTAMVSPLNMKLISHLGYSPMKPLPNSVLLDTTKLVVTLSCDTVKNGSQPFND